MKNELKYWNMMNTNKTKNELKFLWFLVLLCASERIMKANLNAKKTTLENQKEEKRTKTSQAKNQTNENSEKKTTHWKWSQWLSSRLRTFQLCVCVGFRRSAVRIVGGPRRRNMRGFWHFASVKKGNHGVSDLLRVAVIVGRRLIRGSRFSGLTWPFSTGDHVLQTLIWGNVVPGNTRKIGKWKKNEIQFVPSKTCIVD